MALLDSGRAHDLVEGGSVADPPKFVGPASLRDVSDVLGDDMTDVLVVKAHGGQGRLLLADGHGSTAWINAADLAKELAGKVREVVLLACQGTEPEGEDVPGIAPTLAAAGVAVVAAHAKLGVDLADLISRKLCHSLRTRCSLHEAFRMARSAAGANDSLQGGVYGLLSLWQPGAGDIRLRVTRPPSTGLPLPEPDANFDHFVGRDAVTSEIARFVADPHQQVPRHRRSSGSGQVEAPAPSGEPPRAGRGHHAGFAATRP